MRAFLLRIIGLVLTCFLLNVGTAYSQADSATRVVYAKKWSKVNGKPVYSDWTPFRAKTIDKLPGFQPLDKPGWNIYGSDLSLKTIATGFFYTKKIGNRWWIIDPDGYAGLHIAVNGVRTGTSDRNKQTLGIRFGNENTWIDSTHAALEKLGFNGTGSWSATDDIRYSNSHAETPMVYCLIWNFYSSYKRQAEARSKALPFAVFGSDFEKFVDEKAHELSNTKNDPNLLGHFSDNELDFDPGLLDEYLATKDHNDLNYKAAAGFICKMNLEMDQINDSIRELFLGLVAEKYCSIVSAAIKKYDPDHMYLGCRLHGKPKNSETVFRAVSKYADIVSVNYYGSWEPVPSQFDRWKQWTDKPVIITEFYTKALDSGLGNTTGAGWIVNTQEERGIHYQNFCMGLLKQKNCVGWHWFRYMDNDPTDKLADPSNNDSNKGLVNNSYDFYSRLTYHMQLLNNNRYQLIKYFDK